MCNYMKKIVVLGLFVLAGCAIQTPDTVTAMANTELCSLKNNGFANHFTSQEIKRRNLNCDPIFNYCLQSGYEVGSDAFLSCQTALIQKQSQQNIAIYSSQPRQTSSDIFFPEKVETTCTPYGSGVRCVSQDRNSIYRQIAR